jgi:hypothetical protein
VQASVTRRLDEAERRRLRARILDGAQDASAKVRAVASSSLRRRGGQRTRNLELVRTRARRLVPRILGTPEKIGFPAAFSAAAAIWAVALAICLSAFGLVAW